MRIRRGGVLQLQDMANVNRSCIPVFWLCFESQLRCLFGKKWKCNFLHFAPVARPFAKPATRRPAWAHPRPPATPPGHSKRAPKTAARARNKIVVFWNFGPRQNWPAQRRIENRPALFLAGFESGAHHA